MNRFKPRKYKVQSVASLPPPLFTVRTSEGFYRLYECDQDSKLYVYKPKNPNCDTCARSHKTTNRTCAANTGKRVTKFPMNVFMSSDGTPHGIWQTYINLNGRRFSISQISNCRGTQVKHVVLYPLDC